MSCYTVDIYKTLYSKIEKNQPQLLRFRIQNYSARSLVFYRRYIFYRPSPTLPNVRCCRCPYQIRLLLLLTEYMRVFGSIVELVALLFIYF